MLRLDFNMPSTTQDDGAEVYHVVAIAQMEKTNGLTCSSY